MRVSGEPSTSSSVANEAAPAAGKPQPADSWLARLKKPASWLSLGADLRLREEYYNNASTLDSDSPGHEVHYQRYRARLWASFTPIKQVDVNSRITWEYRTYLKPDYRRCGSPEEFVFDSLNVVWRNALTLPVTLTVGRQDIMLGNGWLVMEGTPLDGSRTLFFDAARLTYQSRSRKATVDLIAIGQASSLDGWLPPLHDLKKPVTEQNENGAILYVSTKPRAKTRFDGYFIYKHDIKVLGNGNNAAIYTTGLRTEFDLQEHWKCSFEAAPQWGNKNSRDLRALGGNSRLSYSLKDSHNNILHLGYEYLSGDNPSTTANESFDPLWGRWPQWSELLIFTCIKETRVGEWTNLHRLNVGWSNSLTRKFELAADYHSLLSDENPRRGRTGFSQDGRFRGQLTTALLKCKLTEYLNSRLLWEYLRPGDYYSQNMQDPAHFVRLEFLFKW